MNIAYALTIRARPASAAPLASAALLASLVLVPGGFLVGGLWARHADPGLGILHGPAGAAALVVAAVVIARRMSERMPDDRG